jgi:ankyrin repeat protein
MSESLIAAIRANDSQAVERLIQAGADVNALPEDGDWPPLAFAIEHERIEIMRRLIAAGAHVNRDIGDGWSPLAHAIDLESDGAWQAHHETGHESTELTELLLAAGAVPTPRAFEVAEAYQNLKALALLRQYSGNNQGGILQS